MTYIIICILPLHLRVKRNILIFYKDICYKCTLTHLTNCIGLGNLKRQLSVVMNQRSRALCGVLQLTHIKDLLPTWVPNRSKRKYHHFRDASCKKKSEKLNFCIKYLFSFISNSSSVQKLWLLKSITILEKKSTFHI